MSNQKSENGDNKKGKNNKKSIKQQNPIIDSEYNSFDKERLWGIEDTESENETTNRK